LKALSLPKFLKKIITKYISRSVLRATPWYIPAWGIAPGKIKKELQAEGLRYNDALLLQ
jgi:hypothetical protein